MGKGVVPFGVYSEIYSFKEGLSLARNAQDGTFSILEIASDMFHTDTAR